MNGPEMTLRALTAGASCGQAGEQDLRALNPWPPGRLQAQCQVRRGAQSNSSLPPLFMPHLVTFGTNYSILPKLKQTNKKLPTILTSAENNAMLHYCCLKVNTYFIANVFLKIREYRRLKKIKHLHKG